MLAAAAAAYYHHLAGRARRHLAGKVRQFYLHAIAYLHRASGKHKRAGFYRAAFTAAWVATAHLIQTVVGAWAMAYAVGIYRLALGWGYQLFVFIVGHAVAIGIQRTAMRVYGHAFRRFGAFVKLICYTVQVFVGQHRVGQYHVARIRHFAICMIQRVDPV